MHIVSVPGKYRIWVCKPALVLLANLPTLRLANIRSTTAASEAPRLGLNTKCLALLSHTQSANQACFPA